MTAQMDCLQCHHGHRTEEISCVVCHPMEFTKKK
jgi:hypothetical protein